MNRWAFSASSGLASHRHRALLKLRSWKWGGAVLELYQLPAGTPFDAPRCGIDHLALEVSDLDAVQQRLAALGYPLDEGPIEEDNVRFLLIRGPDGERLEFDACKR